MNQAQTIGTEARNVGVLDKMLAFLLGLVVFVPVAVHAEHGAGAFVHGNDVWQCNTVLILIPRHVVIDLNLKELIPLIVCQGKPLQVSLLFLDVGANQRRFTKVFVTIKPRHLQLAHFIRCFTHHVGYTFRSLCTG